MRREQRGRSATVEVGDLKLHHLEYGDDGAPVIFVLPGITSPAITWEFVAERLALVVGHLGVRERRDAGRGKAHGRFVLQAGGPAGGR